MKIARDKVIRILEERVETMLKDATKNQEKHDKAFIDALSAAADYHTKAAAIYTAAQQHSKSPDAVTRFLSARFAKIRNQNVTPRRQELRLPYDITVIREQIALLELSDDEYVNVRTSSTLHSFLVG